MSKYMEPFSAGYVESRTGRVAVLVKDYADSDLNSDASAYWFSEGAEEFGLDPWKLVEGVDTRIDGQGFDVWFTSGSCKTVGPLMTIFLSANDAAKLAAAKAA